MKDRTGVGSVSAKTKISVSQSKGPPPADDDITKKSTMTARTPVKDDISKRSTMTARTPPSGANRLSDDDNPVF